MAQRNELALILSTPIEELAPKLISWNNTQLLAAVNESLESYRGKVYDEKSITEAKTDVAALRKFATALNSERIRIGKIYDAPLVKFKSEVDAVIQAINTVVSEGDKQIKAYETKRREEKQLLCIDIFNKLLPDDLKDFVKYEAVYQEKWLNSGTTPAAITKEITALVERIKNDIAAITALKSDDEIELKLYYYKTLSLADALQENERIKERKKKIAEVEELRKKVTAAPEVVAAPENKPEQSVKEDKSAESMFSLTFNIIATKEQISALDAYLKANNIKFSVIK